MRRTKVADVDAFLESQRVSSRVEPATETDYTT
jgi:hypothetical protein